MFIRRPILRKVIFKKEAFLEKRLPEEGEILVKVGETVRPFDILGFTFVSLDKATWVLPSALWRVKVSDGQALGRGEVLAEKKGFLWKREYLRMPFPGVISVMNEEGKNLIRAESTPEKYSLISGIDARVAKVCRKLSVLLSTQAYVVNGVFAFGKEAIGEIKTVGNPDSPLLLSSLTPDLSGKIIVAGSYVSAEVVNKAAALGAVAIVVGGVASQISLKSSFPVLVIEGFGKISMNNKTWDYLLSEQLRTAIISPSRKQLIVPHGGEVPEMRQKNDDFLGDLKVGDTIQVFVWPEFGRQAEVLEVGSSPVKLDSGIEDVAATVRFASGEVLKVPVSNLGILR